MQTHKIADTYAIYIHDLRLLTFCLEQEINILRIQIWDFRCTDYMQIIYWFNFKA